MAETREAAVEAVKKVKITYDDVKKPVLDIKDSVHLVDEKQEGESQIFEISKTSTQPVGGTQTIKGEFRIGAQYHMSMETQTCICIPREDGIDVYAATQFTNGVQGAISAVLGIPSNK